MYKTSVLSTVLLSTLLTGCVSYAPLAVLPYFDPVGELGSVKKIELSIDSPEDVKIFLNSAPNGFSLAENELKVLPGYSHKTLGVLKIKYSSGHCVAGDLGRTDLINILKKGTYDNGGNAIIYSSILWVDGTKGRRRCTPGNEDPTYASGWIVKLSK